MVYNNDNTQNSFYFDAVDAVVSGYPGGVFGGHAPPLNLAGTEDAYLTVQALGGYKATDPTQPIDLRFKVNGNVLEILQVPRWTSHFIIMPVMRIVRIPLGILRLGGRADGLPPNVKNNLLVVESVDPMDYFFIGPAVCQY